MEHTTGAPPTREAHAEAHADVSRVEASASVLPRRLGARDGAALVIANVVGVGIFTTPGIVAGMLPEPRSFLALWAVGGLLALCGALVYAELGATYPEAGGEYVYIRNAFGPLAGFLSGWTSFVAGFSGAIAAAAVGFAAYLDRLVPGAGDGTALFQLSAGVVGVAASPRAIVALAVIAALTAAHLRGVGVGRLTLNTLAVLSTLLIVGLIVAGLLAPSAGPGPSSVRPAVPSADRPLLVALVLVMFTYSGWNAPAYVAGEMRRPRRSLRAAVLLGTATVTLLYLGLNLAYIRAVPFDELAGHVAVADAAAAALLGDRAAEAVSVLVIVALASAVSAMIMTGPRIYFAMARDGCFPAALARTSEGARVPAAALLAQGAWSAVLVLTGGFEALVTYTGFAIVVFSSVAVASLFVLRRRPGGSRRRGGSGRAVEAPRPGRVWGYPLTPIVFLLAGAAMLVQAIRHAPAASLAGLGVIAAGLPVYVWSSKRSR